MVKAIIIDDEQHCTDRLSGMLKNHHAGSIQLAASAASVKLNRECSVSSAITVVTIKQAK